MHCSSAHFFLVFFLTAVHNTSDIWRCKGAICFVLSSRISYTHCRCKYIVRDIDGFQSSKQTQSNGLIFKQYSSSLTLKAVLTVSGLLKPNHILISYKVSAINASCTSKSSVRKTIKGKNQAHLPKRPVSCRLSQQRGEFRMRAGKQRE